ncbi:putative DNA helicase [Rhodotorula taiwanensis]|uniref:Transcription initiation factor IIF subunit beta n=1 Tax=Rhodotorula taiwanensis TaxID=741276 RepID=A0A2S5BGR3_9BASI|nr:putative DNA helicase [Rhodotorula taiwanensis]
MAMFNRNSLPEEFEAEHGSVDLADGDRKPASGRSGAQQSPHDDREDEDLDLGRAGQRVWLCKVPRFLLDKWQQSSREGEILGRVRVYDEKTPDGNAKISVLLNEHASTSGNGAASTSASTSEAKPDLKGKRPAHLAAAQAGDGLPTEYKLTMQNTASKNLYVFGEKIEDDLDTGEEGARKKRRVTSLLGTVAHECSLTPVITNPAAAAAYARIMRERQRKASEPKRTLKRLEVDDATANRMASGVGVGGIKARAATFANTTNKRKGATNAAGQPVRAFRMEKPQLLDALISHFQSAPYWSLKSLNEHVKQPQMYLRECLSEIATLIPKGPYANMWTLKPEFKGTAGPSGASTSTLASASLSTTGAEDVKPDFAAAAIEGGVKKEEGVDDRLGDEEDDDDGDLEMVS